MKRGLKLSLTILAVTLVATLLSSFYEKEGGAPDNIEGDNTFTVTEKSLDNNYYYKPSGIPGTWYVHGGKPPPNAICNTNNNPDVYQTVASGWPLHYAYYYGICGTYDTYSPIAFILDFVLLALVFTVLINIWLRMKKS